MSMNKLLAKAVDEIKQTTNMQWSTALPFFGRAFLYILIFVAVEARITNSYYVPHGNADNYNEYIDKVLDSTAGMH
jgi:hypothetical protein